MMKNGDLVEVPRRVNLLTSRYFVFEVENAEDRSHAILPEVIDG